MKRIKGYIFSRSFMGERAPQHVQNIVIRDFCKKNSLVLDEILGVKYNVLYRTWETSSDDEVNYLTRFIKI